MKLPPAQDQHSSFTDLSAAFRDGQRTPRMLLEDYIATIEEREPQVLAWASLRYEDARADADASTQRYKAGNPLSAIDGMPVGIKDLITTKDLPTGLGIEGYTSGNAVDAPSVAALRRAGAIILGKTHTTELGGGRPAATRNPFDLARTPGGSSSGSAAAVAAGMVPLALGTQVAGSVLRPSSYCGVFALKPTYGAFHRGANLESSINCTGVHANSLADLWSAAVEVGTRCGGDPGCFGLLGGLPVPQACAPRRLGIIEGPGWEATPEPARELFQEFLTVLASQGVTLVRARDSLVLDDFHRLLPEVMGTLGVIASFEGRTTLGRLMETIPEKLSSMTKSQYAFAQSLTLADYRRALLFRQSFCERLRALESQVDALLSLSTTGVAPLLDGSGPATDGAEPDNPVFNLPTGSPVYSVPSSLLGAPALTLPLLSLDGLPVGVQIMGQWHADQHLVAMGSWLTQAVGRVSRPN